MRLLLSLLLCILANLASGAPSDDSLLSAGVRLSCSADFLGARASFLAVLSSASSSSSQRSAAQHSLGNLLALEGDLVGSAVLHAQAKESDPTVVPPLAVVYQEKRECNNIGDIFWVSSFAKKKAWDLLSSHGLTSSSDASAASSIASSSSFPPSSRSSLLASHLSLAAQLADSGLVDLSLLHYEAARLHWSDKSDVSLELRCALSTPVLYDSLEAVDEARARLLEGVRRLTAIAEDNDSSSNGNSNSNSSNSDNDSRMAIKTLDQLSVPGTFYVVYQGFNDKSLMQSIRNLYYAFHPKIRTAIPISRSSPSAMSLMPPPRLAPPSSSPNIRRIRIGFVSSFFRRHSVCKLFCGLVTGLPSDRFEVSVYSGVPSPDDWTSAVKDGVAKYRPFPNGLLLSNRDAVLGDDLDVLVYLDVGMDDGTDLWASSRLAPLQLALWGHPVTTGFWDMDYFVTSDGFEPDGGQDRFSEQLLRFDSTTFHFPEPKEVDAAIISGDSKDVYDLSKVGVPDGAFVFLVPQTLPKFHPSFDAAIAAILFQNSLNHLVLTFNKDKPLWRDKLARRLSLLVGPSAASRVHFLPTLPGPDFYRLLAASHVLLDPFPFGGGVTSLEAFQACKAVVTLPGSQTVPRLTKGMLERMGEAEAGGGGGGGGGDVFLARELVAKDLEQYVEFAVGIAQDEGKRKRIEKDICDKKYILFDDKAVVEEFSVAIERAVLQMAGAKM